MKKTKKRPLKFYLAHPLFVAPVSAVLTLAVLGFLMCRTYAFIAFAAYMGSQRAVSFMVEKAVAEKDDADWAYWMGRYSANPDDYPPDMMDEDSRELMLKLNAARKALGDIKMPDSEK